MKKDKSLDNGGFISKGNPEAQKEDKKVDKKVKKNKHCKERTEERMVGM